MTNCLFGQVSVVVAVNINIIFNNRMLFASTRDNTWLICRSSLLENNKPSSKPFYITAFYEVTRQSTHQMFAIVLYNSGYI